MSQSIPNLSLFLSLPTFFFTPPSAPPSFLFLFLSCRFHIRVGTMAGWEVLPCVFGAASGCCFTILSSVRHIEMRSGAGVGSELSKVRNPVYFPCPPASVSHQAPCDPRECVCQWIGKSVLLRPCCSHRLLTSALAALPPALG